MQYNTIKRVHPPLIVNHYEGDMKVTYY